MTVNGDRDVRACQRRAPTAMRCEPARPAAVLIIGAGPAGFAAAAAARARGASVILLDAADELGGQYWRHLAGDRRRAAERICTTAGALHRLRDALEADPRCEISPSARSGRSSTDPAPTCTRCRPGRRRGRAARLPPGRARVRDRRPRPHAAVPGWDLPGVFTAGAAQALAKGERIAVGGRVVVAGAGPFLLPSPRRSRPTGAAVLGVFEASRSAAGARLAAAAVAAARLARQGRRARGLRRGSAPAHPVPPRPRGHRRARHRPGRIGHHRQARRRLAPIPDRTADRGRRRLREPRLHAAARTADRRRMPDRADGFVVVDAAQRPACPACTRRARSPASGAPTPRWPRARSPATARPAAIPATRACAPSCAPGRPGVRRADRGCTRHPPGLADLARPTTRSSAAARRCRTGGCATVAARHLIARSALPEAHHPGRPRHLPGPDLRPHRRASCSVATAAPTAAPSPPPCASANSPKSALS